MEIAWVISIFGHKFNSGVNIWEQNTETEKTNGFDKIELIRTKFSLNKIKKKNAKQKMSFQMLSKG